MDMEILNIPCMYPQQEKRSQRFVFGAPHFAFNPLHFQRLWYRTHHLAEIPEEVLTIMQRMQEIAKGSQITLGQLLQYAMDEPDDELADELDMTASRFSEENIVDIANLIAQKHKAEHAAYEEPDATEPHEEPNPLEAAFAKGSKEAVIAFALEQIGATGNTAVLLEFLLALEGKNIAAVLQEIDHEDAAGLTYKLCMYADCYGEQQDAATLHPLDALLHSSYDDQVRALLVLFGQLEQWVQSKVLPPRIPHDLSVMHSQLAAYLQPLQVNGEKKSQLKALQKLMQEADGGDANAQKKWHAALETKPASD